MDRITGLTPIHRGQKRNCRFDFNSCAVIVAHPDDETLWAGGTILMHPEVRWTVVTLCRKSDRDRAGRFLRAMEYLHNEQGTKAQRQSHWGHQTVEGTKSHWGHPTVERHTTYDIRHTNYDIRINMGDLDDGPEQLPLVENEVGDTIVSLLYNAQGTNGSTGSPSKSRAKSREAQRHKGTKSHWGHPTVERNTQYAIRNTNYDKRFDLIITHSPRGEYTRHKRHEETAKAVCELWKSGRLPARQMWMFAYEDDGGKKLPEPIREADLSVKLSDDIWRKKYHTITKIYGFGPDSFEAKAAGREEAFWCFGVGDDVQKRLRNRSK